jgi:hypothetical protein
VRVFCFDIRAEDFNREPAKDVGPAGGEVKALERFTGL